MSVRTVNYMLTQEVTVSNDWATKEMKVLPSGSFVSPVHFKYVPKHVLDNPKNKGFNENTEVFCYTKYGFVIVPKKALRET